MTIRKEVADALLVIGEKTGSDKQEMETILHHLDVSLIACRECIWGLAKPQLDKFKAGKLIHGPPSDADKNLVEFLKTNKSFMMKLHRDSKMPRLNSDAPQPI
ncbi:hypothetical protein BASA81_008134 [Batrachochytrium salamandrivorans]|nr:hypothetical protein BASA81_008134 [Batrachochytrium salamandrivorans]